MVMTVAGIAEVKTRLSEYLARVRAGEEVLVTDRGRPVARIVPVIDGAPHLRELERRGLMRNPSAALPDDFLDRPRPSPKTGSVRDALLEDRRQGR